MDGHGTQHQTTTANRHVITEEVVRPTRRPHVNNEGSDDDEDDSAPSDLHVVCNYAE